MSFIYVILLGDRYHLCTGKSMCAVCELRQRPWREVRRLIVQRSRGRFRIIVVVPVSVVLRASICCALCLGNSGSPHSPTVSGKHCSLRADAAVCMLQLQACALDQMWICLLKCNPHSFSNVTVITNCASAIASPKL